MSTANLEAKVDILLRYVLSQSKEERAELSTTMEELLGEVAPVTPAEPAPDVGTEVRKVLREIGVPEHLKGYRCMITAVVMVVEDPDIIECITKGLYPAVAKKLGTTPSRVERAIRHAIEVAWMNGDIIMLYSYFGNSISIEKGKPTNTQFLASMGNYIRYEVLGIE